MRDGGDAGSGPDNQTHGPDRSLTRQLHEPADWGLRLQQATCPQSPLTLTGRRSLARVPHLHAPLSPLPGSQSAHQSRNRARDPGVPPPPQLQACPALGSSWPWKWSQREQRFFVCSLLSPQRAWHLAGCQDLWADEKMQLALPLRQTQPLLCYTHHLIRASHSRGRR